MLYLPLVTIPWRELNVGVGVMTQFDYTCEDIALSGADWVHNWSMFPPSCPGVKPVCQRWSPRGLDNERNPECDLVLGPNECSVPAQCNMSAEELATWWPEFELYSILEDVEISTPCDSLWYIQA